MSNLKINIPYNRQSINKKDINFVVSSLKEDLITTGPSVKKFEYKISKLLRSKYAVSCSSGTAALHLSLLSLGLKKGDAIVMPAINFVAMYNLSEMLKLKIYLST